jgi:hypothetical protein
LFKRKTTLKALSAFAILTGTLLGTGGCGAGGGQSTTLFTLRPGNTWVYSVTGTATLPASLGGGTQNLQPNSTFTFTVGSGTAKDANNTDVNILDRKLDVFLLDGREVKATYRLYFTQSTLGLFVHGINDFITDTANPANDRFVPGTVNPPFKFLYLPNPVTDNQSLSYSDPLGLTGSGVGYSAVFGSGQAVVHTPSGDYLAKPFTLAENFNPLTITNGFFVPDTGIVAGTLTATLPDGTKIVGTILLKSKN